MGRLIEIAFFDGRDNQGTTINLLLVQDRRKWANQWRWWRWWRLWWIVACVAVNNLISSLRGHFRCVVGFLFIFRRVRVVEKGRIRVHGVLGSVRSSGQKGCFWQKVRSLKPKKWPRGFGTMNNGSRWFGIM